MISILIVDDHAILRMGLAALFNGLRDFSVVGDASDGLQGVRKALELRPDVVILDLMMPGTDGIETTRMLLDRWPGARILILTTFGTSDRINEALQAGALGAIMKSADFDELTETVRSVAAGRRSVSPGVRRILRDDPPAPTLTPRQVTILGGMARGFSNADIATQLGISAPVVAEHVTAILQKLGAANRTEAVAVALRKHLLIQA